MPEVSLSTSFSILLICLALIGAFLISHFSYRTTNPPISPKRKRILVILRTLGLFLLFLLIGEPLVSLLYRTEQLPVTVILIDDSRSMTIADKAGKRADVLREALASRPLQELFAKGEVHFVKFGDQARSIESLGPDSLQFAGDQTNISGALRYARTLSLTSNVRSVLLLSDGNATTGGNPIFEEELLALPVFSVIVGDTADQKDVLIRKVITNAVVYKGTRVPVNLQVRSTGAQRERVEVTLRRESEIVDRASLLLEPGVHEYPVNLAYVPLESGSQRYTVSVTSLPDELTERNNRSSFSARVLENKMKVMILGGAPSPDIAFLHRSLAADSNMQVTTVIERGGGTHYGPTPTTLLFEAQDCLILAGFPTSATSPFLVDLVREAGSKGPGVLYIPARTVDHAKLTSLLPILPFIFRDLSQTEQQTFFHPRSDPNDLFLKLPDNLPSDGWSKLPPLFSLQTAIRAKPESDVHAVKRLRTIVTEEPLLVSRNVNRRKSVALLGYGLWRWKMLSDPSLDGVLDHWLNTTVRWLTTRDEDRRIRIAPIKKSFTPDEPIEFSGQVYDETLRPIDDAQITLTVKGKTLRNDFTMSSLGNGQYDARARAMQEGDYAFEAIVRRGGAEAGRVSGSFSIGESNAEFLETRSNALHLRQLAAQSGGRFYFPDNIGSITDDISSLPDFRPSETLQSADLALWTNPWALFTIVLLFSLEWVLRKQSGML
ncbi:MAG: vWA domain-containing protein [Bacteroidota bacterium]